MSQVRRLALSVQDRMFLVDLLEAVGEIASRSAKHAGFSSLMALETPRGYLAATAKPGSTGACNFCWRTFSSFS